MPLVEEREYTRMSGLVPQEEYLSSRDDEDEVDDGEDDLTEEEQAKLKIIRYCNRLFEDARKAREPYETFDIAWDCFVGNMWPQRWPTWRAKIGINKIRAYITFMVAVMTDNKPRISVEPLVPGTEDAADLLRKLVDRDWDENNMQQKLTIFVLYGLIWGTGFMQLGFDPFAEGGRGKHTAMPRVPYRIYTNRTATCLEDAEYLVDDDDLTMGWIRRNFPEKARVVEKVCGPKYSADRERDRDYIREGEADDQPKIISAQNVDGNMVGPQYARPHQLYNEDDSDTVNVKKFWFKDDSLEKYERQKVVNGVPQTTEKINPETGLYDMEPVGVRFEMSPIDGSLYMRTVYAPKRVPVMETAWRPQFPNGRLVMIAGGKVLLRDIPNPYQISDVFPYAMWKDYDIGAFWGQGEPLAMKDAQVAMQRVISQIYDILEKTGNPSFKLKKGAGINPQSIKNKPGAVIPMDELDALQALDKPPMPPQFVELYNLLNGALGEISGVSDVVRGLNPGPNVSFATIDQLQESTAAPIRLKVRNMEVGIQRMGKIRVQLIQQYDRGDRPLRERIEQPRMPIETENGEVQVVTDANTVEVKFRAYTNPELQGLVEFNIVPISSLSTSPAGLWARWMDLYTKHLIDRRWWHEKFRIDGWKTQLPRMERDEAMAAQREAMHKKKPGPAPSRPARAARKPQPPTLGGMPTRAQISAIR